MNLMDLARYFWDSIAGAWTVTGQMAPYLLFGFLVAGILSIYVSPQWVERHLGGRGIGPILKSVLFGIPLPLCSCGVIPVSASIRNHGASRGATVGFLLATPQTGVDSILATWGMLGPVLAVFRPLAALVTGVLGGALVDRLEPDNQNADDSNHPAGDTCVDTCCSGDPRHGKIVRALHHGFVVLPRDIGKALLVGVLIAGLIATFVPKDFFVEYLGGGPLAMIVMMLVAVPIYVCSTASIPVAVGFLHMGVSPGAALVFLIAGPATNAATIAAVWKVLGRRTAMIYLGTVAVGSLLAGLGFDAIAGYLGDLGAFEVDHAHEMGLRWYGHLMAAALLLLVAGAVLSGRRKPAAKTTAPAPSEQTITLQISGMTCSHCSSTVTRGLRESPGVSGAEVELSTGLAVVTGENLDVDALKDVVRNLGYGVDLAAGG